MNDRWPPTDCPKCGERDAFREPEYHPRRDSYHVLDVRDCGDNSEHLCWACCWCGYRRVTLTVDQVAESAIER